MTQPTLGLLERLRPPVGFRTEAAFGTTYSADLLTCMAVLTTLDGGEGERIRYGRVEAYRALDRLRNRIRIFHSLGCLSRRDGQKYPSLALLDRVLVPITVPGAGSFHPKVWLTRQVGPAGEERFILIVSSRNVTISTDWDFGVALEGSASRRGIQLPRLSAFVEYVSRLGEDQALLGLFGGLNGVQWELPRGVKGLDFDFQESTTRPPVLHGVWGSFPARATEALLISPFIDGRMIHEAAKRWRGAERRRLVAGTEGLVTVALGGRRDELRALQPAQLSASAQLGARQDEYNDSELAEEEEEQSRALHAKVIAIADGRRATVVIGSNNLTSNGWCGGSVEALIRLQGDNSLTKDLWEWQASHALVFDFPEVDAQLPTKPLLETEAERLRTLRFRLDESQCEHGGSLSLIEPATLELVSDFRVTVSRYTTPSEAVWFPAGASSVNLPGCKRALRTGLIVCTLQFEDEQTSWTTHATMVPPIDDSRDRELVAHLLSPRDFLAYLQSIGAADPLPGPEEGDPMSDTWMPGVERSNQRQDSFSLEGLLKQLAEQPTAFAEFDATINRYGELIKAENLSTDDAKLLGEFLEAWSVIREAKAI